MLAPLHDLEAWGQDPLSCLPPSTPLACSAPATSHAGLLALWSTSQARSHLPASGEAGPPAWAAAPPGPRSLPHPLRSFLRCHLPWSPSLALSPPGPCLPPHLVPFSSVQLTSLWCVPCFVGLLPAARLSPSRAGISVWFTVYIPRALAVPAPTECLIKGSQVNQVPEVSTNLAWPAPTWAPGLLLGILIPALFMNTPPLPPSLCSCPSIVPVLSLGIPLSRGSCRATSWL